MLESADFLFVVTRCRLLSLTGLALVVASPGFAQAISARTDDVCSTDRAAIYQLYSTVSHMALWDDPTMARARNSFARLQELRVNVIRLTRRLYGAEASAANAEAFDKSGEVDYWRRDAAEVRAAIATENTRAKRFAADAGVSCAGCTYSVLVAKVEAAINAAVSARTQALQARQQIARYRADMSAAGCQE
ncbi:MAG TPA: hypothetical protein VGU01_16065 [Sphingomicrobium sp.]|nr:hypothetical protein [Sphingomicrobium sp.]